MENGRFVKICGIVKQLGFTAEQKAEFINIVNSIVPVDYEGKLKRGQKASVKQKQILYEALVRGYSLTESARLSGLSKATAIKYRDQLSAKGYKIPRAERRKTAVQKMEQNEVIQKAAAPVSKQSNYDDLPFN